CAGAGGIALSYNEADMKRRAKIHRATMPAESLGLSNQIFIAGCDMTKRAMAAAAAAEDKAYLATAKHPDARRRWIIAAITTPMTARFGDTEQVRRIIDGHAEYWSAKRSKKPVARGRDKFINVMDG